MKIGIVCPYNLYRPGGVQEVVLAHQAELKKLGHTAVIITPKSKNIPKPAPKDIIFIGLAVEWNTPFHTKADITYVTSNQALDGMLREEQFDVIHFHEPWLPMLSRQLLARSRAVNVATFHAKLPDSFLNRSFEKVISPYAKAVLRNLHHLSAVSDVAREYVGSLTKEPIEIIPNGINLNRFDPARVKSLKKYQDGKKNIIYINRLEERKGAIYLLKAYSKLCETRSDLRLLIAGDGDKRTVLENYTKRNKLPHVEFLGFINENEKLRLYKTCHIFCSPALYGESFGIVLLEAMAMNAVIVAGNNEGYRSVLKDVGALSLVNPRETEEFSHRLEVLLDNKHLRSKLINWGQNEIKKYDYGSIVKRYEQIYIKLNQTRDKLLKKKYS